MGKKYLEKKVCPQCGKDFQPVHESSIYCCYRCFYIHRKQQAKQLRREGL